MGLSVLLWGKVPVDSSCLGSMAAIFVYFILFSIFRAAFEELARAVGLSVLHTWTAPAWAVWPSSCFIYLIHILFNIQGQFEELARAVGLSVLWREVPVDSSCLGSMAAILFILSYSIFRAGFEELARAVGLSVLLWWEVPVDSSCPGSMAAILFYFILFNIQG